MSCCSMASICEIHDTIKCIVKTLSISTDVHSKMFVKCLHTFSQRMSVLRQHYSKITIIPMRSPGFEWFTIRKMRQIEEKVKFLKNQQCLYLSNLVCEIFLGISLNFLLIKKMQRQIVSSTVVTSTRKSTTCFVICKGPIRLTGI